MRGTELTMVLEIPSGGGWPLCPPPAGARESVVLMSDGKINYFKAALAVATA